MNCIFTAILESRWHHFYFKNWDTADWEASLIFKRYKGFQIGIQICLFPFHHRHGTAQVPSCLSPLEILSGWKVPHNQTSNLGGSNFLSERDISVVRWGPSSLHLSLSAELGLGRLIEGVAEGRRDNGVFTPRGRGSSGWRQQQHRCPEMWSRQNCSFGTILTSFLEPGSLPSFSLSTLALWPLSRSWRQPMFFKKTLLLSEPGVLTTSRCTQLHHPSSGLSPA